MIQSKGSSITHSQVIRLIQNLMTTRNILTATFRTFRNTNLFECRVKPFCFLHMVEHYTILHPRRSLTGIVHRVLHGLSNTPRERSRAPRRPCQLHVLLPQVAEATAVDIQVGISAKFFLRALVVTVKLFRQPTSDKPQSRSSHGRSSVERCCRYLGMQISRQV